MHVFYYFNLKNLSSGNYNAPLVSCLLCQLYKTKSSVEDTFKTIKDVFSTFYVFGVKIQYMPKYMVLFLVMKGTNRYGARSMLPRLPAPPLTPAASPLLGSRRQSRSTLLLNCCNLYYLLF